jgi:hypothetical protein
MKESQDIFRNSVTLAGVVLVTICSQEVAGVTRVTPSNYQDMGFRIIVRLDRKAVFFTIEAKTVAFGIIESDYAKLLLGRAGDRGGCRVAGESTQYGAKWIVGVPIELVNDAQFMYQDSYLNLSDFLKPDSLLNQTVQTYLLPSGKIKVVLSVTAITGVSLMFNSDCHFRCTIKRKDGLTVGIDPEYCGGTLTSLHIPAEETRVTEFIIPRFGEPLEPGEYRVIFGVLEPQNARFLPSKSVGFTIPVGE